MTFIELIRLLAPITDFAIKRIPERSWLDAGGQPGEVSINGGGWHDVARRAGWGIVTSRLDTRTYERIVLLMRPKEGNNG